MSTERSRWPIAKPDQDPGVGPAQLPSSELWGREVYDPEGHRVGVIDSIVRTHRGPVRAIVQMDERHGKVMFVDLDAAVLDGEVVVVSFTARRSSAAEDRPRPRFEVVWPLQWGRPG